MRTRTSALGILFICVLAVAGLGTPAGAEGDYVGSEVCLSCHEDVQHAFSKTRHGKLFNAEFGKTALMRQGCEGCHGPGSEHVDAGGGKAVGSLLAFRAETPAAAERESAACLACHSGGHQLYWEGSEHESRGLACTSCHSSHEARSEHAQLKAATEGETCASCHLIQRSRQSRHSRMPLAEGHMQCSSCHNSHGSVSEAMIKHVTINDNCQSCHADKRGPFLWEHPPVNEDCLSCHVPHGSSKRNMLRVDVPRLCQQCHVASRHPSEPRAPDDRFVASGSCLSCHINIHGSNHPAGFVFSR